MTETLDTQEFINILKAKNIKFNIINEFKALNYLKYCNSYYDIISYEKNFEKYYINGKIINKYIDLDFSYFIDLAEIDFELKSILFKMVTIIEHHLKLRILNLFENYAIDNELALINEFLESTDIKYFKNIKRTSIHNFFKTITFGSLIEFYNYFIKKYKLKNEYKNVQILRDIVKLRNGVCHLNNIIAELNIREKGSVNELICKFLNRCNISKTIYLNKLKNPRTKQITYTLYMFNLIVTDKVIKDKVKKEINNLLYKRIVKNKEYYQNNLFLNSIYDYYCKIINLNYKI